MKKLALKNCGILSYITLLFILVVTWRTRAPAKKQRDANICAVLFYQPTFFFSLIIYRPLEITQ